MPPLARSRETGGDHLHRLSRYVHAYHPMVHVLVLGTVLTSLTSSMSVVFLPVYLMHQLHTDPMTIGWIVGAGALAATIGGFLGGTLSDLLGRRLLVLSSLCVTSLVFIGFVGTTNTFFLVLLNAIRGLCSSFFVVVSKAMVADLTPKENRYRAFSNRYLAGNVGYSIGPVMGASIGLAGNATAFLFAAFVYFVYFLVMVFLGQSERVKAVRDESMENASILQAWGVFRRDRVLFLFILGSAMLTAVHGEMSVTLSQYLVMSTTDGGKLFARLMSVNGLTVIFTQVLISRWSERFELYQRVVLGCLLFAVGETGFSFSTGWVAWIVSMLVFTFGEILIIPSEYALVDEITPDGMRGMYYGAQSFNEVGNMIGPWFGGLLLVSCGGQAMFLVMALLSLCGLALYGLGRKQHSNRTRALTNRGLAMESELQS